MRSLLSPCAAMHLCMVISMCSITWCQAGLDCMERLRAWTHSHSATWHLQLN